MHELKTYLEISEKLKADEALMKMIDAYEAETKQLMAERCILREHLPTIWMIQLVPDLPLLPMKQKTEQVCM